MVHIYHVYLFKYYCTFLAADQGRQMAMQMNMQQSAMGGGKQQPSQMFKVSKTFIHCCLSISL